MGEDLLGDLDRGHRLGPAGVERQVHDRLLQFGLGEAVLLGEAQMIPELLEAARGDQGRDRDEASVALGKFRPLPDVAEQDLVGELDQLRGEVTNRTLTCSPHRAGVHGLGRVHGNWLTAVSLDECDAVGDREGLADGVDVPGGPRAGRESVVAPRSPCVPPVAGPVERRSCYGSVLGVCCGRCCRSCDREAAEELDAFLARGSSDGRPDEHPPSGGCRAPPSPRR